MSSTSIQRRSFLKTASQALIAAPALAAFEPLAASQESTKAAVHKPAAPAFKPSLVINVRDLGATGDGTTMDSKAIRLAIERCAVLGGGEVLFPAGD